MKTENGAVGVAVCTAGISVGQHEVQFTYDGGAKWRGRGVQKAVDNVSQMIAPALKGMDASRQPEVDDAMLNIGGPGAKLRLGGNATAAVSAAVLKAGAACLGIPLYQHIGGVNACTLPVPGKSASWAATGTEAGSAPGGNPAIPSWPTALIPFQKPLTPSGTFRRNGGRSSTGSCNPQGLQDESSGHPGWRDPARPGNLGLDGRDCSSAGIRGKVGFQVDVAAGTYYEKHRDRFVGLFSAEDKTRDELMKLYRQMVKDYLLSSWRTPLTRTITKGMQF